MRVILQEKMQDSGTFVQLRFTPKPETPLRKSEEESKSSKAERGFGSLWDEL
jgi:dUTPase